MQDSEAMPNGKVSIQQYLTSKDRAREDQVGTHYRTSVLWKPWDFDTILSVRKLQERVISKFPSCPAEQRLKIKINLENKVSLILSFTPEFIVKLIPATLLFPAFKANPLPNRGPM